MCRTFYWAIACECFHHIAQLIFFLNICFQLYPALNFYNLVLAIKIWFRFFNGSTAFTESFMTIKSIISKEDVFLFYLYLKIGLLEP